MPECHHRRRGLLCPGTDAQRWLRLSGGTIDILFSLIANTTGDGLLTAVQLLSIMKTRQKPLSELAGIMTKYPQILKNVTVQTKSGWENNNLIMAAIAAGEEELGDEGRILVRPSGTEPLIRVMAEGPDLDQLQRIVDDIALVVEHEMGPSK